MKQLPILKSGDTVDIVLPASRCTPAELQDLVDLLKSWELNVHVPENIFGDDLFASNSDETRATLLKQAITNPHSKAIICARGGYGSMRLIPALASLSPETSKIFVGMSDITALHLYFLQKWQWSTIHAGPAPSKFSAESIHRLKSLLFGEVTNVHFNDLIPLNKLAETHPPITSTIVGGNLCLLQASVGTPWQLDARGKMILIEEIGERAYRIDRMLAQLQQANIFQQTKAIIFGDFLDCNEPDNTSLVLPTLQRFANNCDFPVVQVKGIGHGHTNFPIPLGTPTTLELRQLTIARNISNSR